MSVIEIYPEAMKEIKDGVYSQFQAKQSQMNPKNWGVYGKAKSSGRWRAMTDCAPDRPRAEQLAQMLNDSFTGPMWVPQ